jgi:hypothetical protein
LTIRPNRISRVGNLAALSHISASLAPLHAHDGGHRRLRHEREKQRHRCGRPPRARDSSSGAGVASESLFTYSSEESLAQRTASQNPSSAAGPVAKRQTKRAALCFPVGSALEDGRIGPDPMTTTVRGQSAAVSLSPLATIRELLRVDQDTQALL